MRYCLDTSAYSHFKRGAPEAVDVIDRAEWIGVPVIVLGELTAGFRQGDRSAANQAELDEFLANAAVEVLPILSDVVPIYADIVLGLRKAGTPIPANDIWIAAVAARHGAAVLTYDAHFEAIPRVGALVLKAPGPSPESA
jgi:tRNA(fMet)-specific endonuclease VapC